MISEGQFIEEWEKLEASFGRTTTKKIRREWFQELEERVEPLDFKATMYRLTRGEKFPNWKMFWDDYNANTRTAEVRRGCRDCYHGHIHYLQVSPRGPVPGSDRYAPFHFGGKCFGRPGFGCSDGTPNIVF